MTVETVDPLFPITVTAEAREHLSSYVKQAGATGVKLSLKPSGCAGFSYNWDLVHEYSPNAEEYQSDLGEFIFILDSLSADNLVGSTVEIEHLGIQGKVLVVNSPKKVSACGCGESVSFDE